MARFDQNLLDAGDAISRKSKVKYMEEIRHHHGGLKAN